MNSETVVIVFLVLTTALVPFSGELAVIGDGGSRRFRGRRISKQQLVKHFGKGGSRDE